MGSKIGIIAILVAPRLLMQALLRLWTSAGASAFSLRFENKYVMSFSHHGKGFLDDHIDGFEIGRLDNDIP